MLRSQVSRMLQWFATNVVWISNIWTEELLFEWKSTIRTEMLSELNVW